MRRIETNDWWPELVKLKDKLSLRELAEKFSVTPGAISAAFKRTGITRKPAPPGPRARRKGPEEEALPPEPGEAPADAARPGSKDNQIEPFVHLLGNRPDSEVAEQANVSVRTIASYRSRMGIPGYTGPRKRRGPGPGRKSKIDAFADMLGQVPDRVIAEQAGVTLNAVRNYRAKRGIPAATRGGSTPTPAPTTPAPTTTASPEAAPRRAPVPAAGANHSAYRITSSQNGSEDVHIVVATSLSDAASRAESAGLGHVVSLEWIGSVL